MASSLICRPVCPIKDQPRRFVKGGRLPIGPESAHNPVAAASTPSDRRSSRCTTSTPRSRKQQDAAAARVAAATDSRQARVRSLTDPEGRPRKVVGTEDFLAVRYLAAGVRAARAVGRVVIREDGQVAGFGTGSLVSPSLLLTNHHVLPSADVADGSSVEFSFEDGTDGQPLTPVTVEPRPGRFFLADEELDFALVAVAATPDALDRLRLQPSARG